MDKKAKVLCITHDDFINADRGHRIRILQIVQGLQEYCEVDVFCISRESAGSGPKTIPTILAGIKALLTGKSISESSFVNSRNLKLLKKFTSNKQYDLVFLSASSLFPFYEELTSKKLWIDYCDADSLKWQILSNLAKGPKSYIYQREAKLVRELEVASFALVDFISLVSKKELQQINPSLDCKAEAFTFAPSLQVNKLFQKEYYENYQFSTENPLKIAFLGTSNYEPNKLAINYLIEKIYPRLRELNLPVKILIAGQGASKFISNDIECLEEFSKLESVYQDSHLLVCPFIDSIGLPLKIIEALACGQVVLTSDRVAEQINATNNKNILSANDLSTYVLQIEKIFKNSENLKTISENALTFARDKFLNKAKEESLKIIQIILSRLSK